MEISLSLVYYGWRESQKNRPYTNQVIRQLLVNLLSMKMDCWLKKRGLHISKNYEGMS